MQFKKIRTIYIYISIKIYESVKLKNNFFFLNGWEEVKLILNYWVFVSIKLYLKKWFQIKNFINLEIIGEKDKNIKKN